MNKTDKEYVDVRVLSNAPCMRALKNVLCWYNYPKCNDLNSSLPLCKNSCERFYWNCRYEPSGSGEMVGCSADTVAREGLFGSKVVDSSQTIAEVDGSVCN